MSQRSARILKQPNLSAAQAVDYEQESFAPMLRRIPSAAYQAPEALAAAEQRRPRIIRRTDAHPAAPFPLEAFEVDTDWQPASLSAGKAAREPEPEPEPEPPTTEELLAERDAAWEARLEAAVAQARQQAFAEGQASIRQKMQDEVDTLRNDFVADLARIEEAHQTFIQQAEPALARLAFAVAETVLDAPLPEELRAVSQRTITEAVERLVGDSGVEVSLHPVDYLRLQEAGVVEQLSATHPLLRWHPDANLKQGEWIVESPVGATRHLQVELLDALRRRLGIHKDD